MQCNSRKSHCFLFPVTRLCLGYLVLGTVAAQISMPVNYLPKEYFLSDGRRDPRHILPQHQQPYFSGQATATYHLNPTGSSNNPIGSFSTNHLHHPIMNNQFGEKLSQQQNDASTTISNRLDKDSKESKRHRRRLMKLAKKLPKSLRPPKEYIIYSLPEQSFWALNHPGDPLATDPQSQKIDDEDRSHNEDEDDDEDDEDGDDDSARNDRLNNDKQSKNTDEKNVTSSSLPLSTENKNKDDEINTSPSSSAGSPTLAEKKIRLGQCMKYCMDAIL